MKKRILALISAAVIALAFTGCGADETENTAAGESAENGSESSQTAADRTAISQITQTEIEGLSENQFYAANLMGTGITEIYVSENGSGDWGNNLISSPITDGQKVIISVPGMETGKEYDICVIDSEDNTTEYYGFDIASTVQVTFYEDAQCDVSTI